MKDLFIKATDKTPEVRCQSESGQITITGICVPEDAVSFFVPIKEWVELYTKNGADSIHVMIDLRYFNTSTSRILLNIFRLFTTMINRGNDVKFIWIYEEDDYDMKEAGEDYMEIVGDCFILQSKPAPTEQV